MKPDPNQTELIDLVWFLKNSVRVWVEYLEPNMTWFGLGLSSRFTRTDYHIIINTQAAQQAGTTKPTSIFFRSHSSKDFTKP